jgi:SAM-dependent methyltransferase
LPPTANIIDIGGGDSHLIDALLEKGYQNIWVLDISAKAIERAKERLGNRANRVHWIVSDVTEYDFKSLRFDLWHDRAAFHFLTTDDKIDRYVSLAKDAISKDGYLVLGTFSEEGPEKCSGLRIKQYSETSMAAKFEGSFDRIKCIHENHITPFNTIQNFLFCSFKKK